RVCLMAVKKRAPARLPTLAITCQIPYQTGLELQVQADALGLTRHRLFFLAFQAGLPLILEQGSAHKAGDTAAQPQQQG
ncbi:MAG TPA: hypothetical protein VHR86_01160, partial [Armatimonadota bacterium]|nr:hypothetical protein [Armatimonadota bacterium]